MAASLTFGICQQFPPCHPHCQQSKQQILARCLQLFRPVTLIVGYGAGGATDIIARTFAERMQPLLGQPMVVQNVTGAGGTIASDRVAKVAPDGHTILLIPNAHAVAPGLYARLPYDTAGDFTALFFAGNSANVLVVPANSPARNVAEFVAAAKAQKPTTSEWFTAARTPNSFG